MKRLVTVGIHGTYVYQTFWLCRDFDVLGERDLAVSQTNEGQKYIAVKDGGNLQIHGTEKLHWTKLTATVDRYNVDTSKVHFDHSVSLCFLTFKWTSQIPPLFQCIAAVNDLRMLNRVRFKMNVFKIFDYALTSESPVTLLSWFLPKTSGFPSVFPLYNVQWTKECITQ